MSIRVLVVGDGPFMVMLPSGGFGGGIQFLKDASGRYVQDLTDNTFTVSEFIYLLTTATRGISVDTAHRRDDPNADLPNFNFATSTFLGDYDLLWIFGYEGFNSSYYGSAIAPDEIQAISQYMQDGGGVFAVGDHEGMGSFICGQIPRVRTMRNWYGQQGDLPPGVPATAVNSQGETVTSVNWPGLGSTRADTLQRNPGDVEFTFQFDDQSDAILQPLSFPGGQVHPILADQDGPVSRFPDHMHEGEVVTPLDPSLQVTVNGQPPVSEYPASGFLPVRRPLPAIIATGQVNGGHETTITGTQCEISNFHSDNSLTAANRELGILCVYDGRDVGVGRVVTDSSFHHYLDINLVGDPCGSTPDRQRGSGAARTPPAAGSALADLQAFYVNTAEWLARAKCEFFCLLPADRVLKSEVAATLTGSTPGVLSGAFSVVASGFSAAELGITPGDLHGTPGVVPAFTSTRAGLAVTATSLRAEDASLPLTPQQFTWTCAADFATSLSAFTGVSNASPAEVILSASIAGASGAVALELALIGGPPRTG